jgi:2-iminobutanoate/2-iminopropanoate deaminase
VDHPLLVDRIPRPEAGPHPAADRRAGDPEGRQLPLDPVTNQLVEGDIAVQTERVLENLKAVLEACGSSMDKVLKTTVFLKDMGEFPKMNEVYGRYFPKDPPARATVEAARLPRDVRVEIECIAAVG